MMFKHLFSYSLKRQIRQKDTMFWTMIFPIILATLFNITLANMATKEEVTQIPIALVVGEAAENNESFIAAIESISVMKGAKSSGEEKEGEVIFLTTLTDGEAAKEMLYDGEIEGYYIVSASPSLVVNESGSKQAVMKSFLDRYEQREAAVNTILEQGAGETDYDHILKEKSGGYFMDLSITEDKISSVVMLYYILISMACMYSVMPGINLAINVWANQTPVAARNGMGGISKFKLFRAGLLSTLVVQNINILVLLAYIRIILSVDLRNKIAYTFLICMLGNMTGICLGVIIGGMVKGKESTKSLFGIGIVMFGSFLGGMLNLDIKYLIQKEYPVIAKINPINALIDCFYSLYYYGSSSRLSLAILQLLIWCVGMFVIIGIMLRRNHYEYI